MDDWLVGWAGRSWVGFVVGEFLVDRQGAAAGHEIETRLEYSSRK